jgi:hypothetical protein
MSAVALPFDTELRRAKKYPKDVYLLCKVGVVGWSATLSFNHFQHGDRALTKETARLLTRLPAPATESVVPYETTPCSLAEIGGDPRIFFPRYTGSGLPWKGLDPADYKFLFAFKGTRSSKEMHHEGDITCVKACFEHKREGTYTMLTALNRSEMDSPVCSLVDGWWACKQPMIAGAVFWNKLIDTAQTPAFGLQMIADAYGDLPTTPVATAAPHPVSAVSATLPPPAPIAAAPPSVAPAPAAPAEGKKPRKATVHKETRDYIRPNEVVYNTVCPKGGKKETWAATYVRVADTLVMDDGRCFLTTREFSKAHRKENNLTGDRDGFNGCHVIREGKRVMLCDLPRLIV